MADFDGKVILVTGGATGLGAAIAIGAAKRGAKALILNYSKSRKEAEATAEAVRAAGAEAASYRATWARTPTAARSRPPRRHMASSTCWRTMPEPPSMFQSTPISTVYPRTTSSHLRHQHGRSIPDDPRLPEPAGGVGLGQRADDVVDRRRHWRRIVSRLRRLQGRAQHHDQVARPRTRAKNPGQRDLSGLHRYALVRRRLRQRLPERLRDNVRSRRHCR